LIANTAISFGFEGKMKKDIDSIILTRQELQIMKVVWDKGVATVKEVCDAMSQTKVTAYTTILTLMGILEEKGALVHTRSGRAYVYKPVLSREQATRNQVHDVLTRFFDGNPEKMLVSVLESEVKEPGQVETVKNLLESWQQEPGAAHNQVA
jgi:BlaI family transcriptional regulator, penicillinase repressor